MTLALSGCAGGGDSVTQTRQTQSAQPEPASTEIRRTDPEPEPATELVAATPEVELEPVEPVQPEAEPAPEDTPTDSISERPMMRDDGRPTWWFEGMRQADQGVRRICAESLGSTIREARSRAIDAARRELEGLDGEFAIELAWVWPLPNASQGGARYAGYVLASVTE
ncbi:MAG: hypothetical protein AAFX05_08360 [Planctomycetota bacterium]